MAKWWVMDTDLSHLQASQFYGQGVDRMFPGGARETSPPWPRAGSYKDIKDYDEGLVSQTLQRPPQLQDVDPRNLHSTQPGIIRAAVDHYSGPEYHETGQTFERRGGNEGNRFPVIYRREAHPRAYSNEPQNLILSGHHRAAAALAEGRPLRAVVVEGSWGGPRTRTI